MLVVALVGLGACKAPSNAPSDYDALTEENFIDGCTAESPPPDTTDLGTGASPEYCQCVYNWYVNNLPYSEGNGSYDNSTFKGLNSSLSKEPEGLPQSIKDAVGESCGTSEASKTPGTTTPTTVGDEVPDTTSTSVAG